jgi:hypothetical protein
VYKPQAVMLPSQPRRLSHTEQRRTADHDDGSRREVPVGPQAEMDDLMAATRYGMMMLRFARCVDAQPFKLLRFPPRGAYAWQGG